MKFKAIRLESETKELNVVLRRSKTKSRGIATLSWVGEKRKNHERRQKKDQ